MANAKVAQRRAEERMKRTFGKYILNILTLFSRQRHFHHDHPWREAVYDQYGPRYESDHQRRKKAQSSDEKTESVSIT